LPIYIGYETKCALTPLIVMFVALNTDWKLVCVIFPLEVVIPV